MRKYLISTIFLFALTLFIAAHVRAAGQCCTIDSQCDANEHCTKRVPYALCSSTLRCETPTGSTTPGPGTPCSGALDKSCGTGNVCSYVGDGWRCIAQSAVSGIKHQTTCQFVADPKQRQDCEQCFQTDPPGAWTAIGCIPTNPTAFIAKILTFGIGIGGGIAFILILFGGFQILTSAGNPEHLNAGRELIGSAISGLLLIIFSVFLLKLIGVDILGLPGFK